MAAAGNYGPSSDLPSPHEQGPLDQRTKDLYAQVFDNELLREKIVDFVIRKGTQVSPIYVYTCRLVQRAWLTAVSKSLIKSGQPLLKFYLPDQNSNVGEFLETYASSSRLMEPVPPFSLSISIQFPQRQDRGRGNVPVLFGECLRWCSGGMVSLEMELTIFDDDNPLIFPEIPESLSLPVLQKVSMCLLEYVPYRRDGDQIPNRIFTTLVQPILSGCKQLTSFTLQGCLTLVRSAPLVLQSLNLPATVTQLDIGKSNRADYLEQLMSNTMPPLTKLIISIPNYSMEYKDFICGILERVNNTLEALYILAGDFPKENGKPTKLDLPVMKCLKSVVIRARNYEWTDEVVVNLQRRLPAIRKIEMGPVAPTMLERWTHYSRFESVQEVHLELAEPTSEPLNEEFTLLLAVLLPDAFPNLQKLQVSAAFAKDAYHSFHYLFGNLPQLEILSISFYAASFVSDSESFWNLLLVGTPNIDEEVPAVTDTPITNLSELRELELCLRDSIAARRTLADAVFESLFRKMPKLQIFNLRGKLKASPEVIEKWNGEGREIHCSGDI